MHKKTTTRHMIDILFVLSLFCVFAFSSVVLILFGADIYKKTVSHMRKTDQLNTTKINVMRWQKYNPNSHKTSPTASNCIFICEHRLFSHLFTPLVQKYYTKPLSYCQRFAATTVPCPQNCRCFLISAKTPFFAVRLTGIITPEYSMMRLCELSTRLMWEMLTI